MRIKRKHIYTFCLLLCEIVILWVVHQCANPSSPTGGPRDILPPIIVKTVPKNYSVNFNSDKIYLYFDEFVKLKNVSSQVFISPPVEKLPKFKVVGKSVIIQFEEELRDNVTYVIYLGESIVDITEGNPLTDFSFVFSTGSKLDSLSIQGEVINAFSVFPEEDVFVMLYQDNNDTIPPDSLPYLVKPIYVSKTSSNGRFELNNLRGDMYKLFALKDVNSNLLYDLPNEEIAFIDSLIFPIYLEQKPDTTMADTLNIQDTIVADTSENLGMILDSIQSSVPEYPFYLLRMFNEIDSVQKLKNAELTKEKLLSFIFRFPVRQPVVEPVGYYFEEEWKIEELNRNRDTLKFWLLDMDIDSLTLKISDDTLVIDTVELPLKIREKKRKLRKAEQSPVNLKYSTNIEGNTLDIYKPLVFNYTYPLINYDFTRILFIEQEDTIPVDMYIVDMGINRRSRIDHKWKENTLYTVIITDSVMTDLLNRQNDSINIVFKTRSLEDYGLLIVQVDLLETVNPYIIQLLDGKERVINERIIRQSAQLIFEYLKPGKYFLKAIRDANRNSRWDTGDYLKIIQPEEVFYFNSPIDVRANWEIKEIWEIGTRNTNKNVVN